MRIQLHKLHQQALIDLPASKSISNRALIIQYLCPDTFSISNLSDANDTVILSSLLEKIIHSQDEILALDVADAGTPFRFLTALLSTLTNKKFTLYGSARLHQRPIEELIDALKCIGADISYLEIKGYAPIFIQGKKLHGEKLTIHGAISSQFISALCLIAPTLPKGLSLYIQDRIVSAPYINLTLRMMEQFGIQINESSSSIHIPPQPYQATNYIVENDWSSATFFYAIAMLLDQPNISFQQLSTESLQGDAYIQKLALDFGIQTIFNNNTCTITRFAEIPSSIAKTYDLNNYPDLAIPFIVVCALKYPNINIRGIYHLEWKESKRISALTIELKKIGIELTYENDILTFKNEALLNKQNSIRLNTYSDHRIAMALSMLAIYGYDIELDDTNCVQKSFPNYFTELNKIIDKPL